MQKCLGIYIEDNLIKYAKVSKERDNMKVESFGVRFFQDINEEIAKIVEETFSFNTPISINLANERYLYFDVFALLNKKDIERTVQTEFENFCEEKNFNKDAFETRYALMENKGDKEKVRALDIYVNKIEYNKQISTVEKYKLLKVMPMPMAIANIAELDRRANEIIINMEANTTITTILGNDIYNVDIIDEGSKDVLEKINKMENSYAKAYDICKNTTIYTAESEELAEEQQYLQYVMPTIYKIAEKLQDAVNSSSEKIKTVYLSGTLATINNIDLYFQEFLPNVECKILKPKIVDETVTKINIKDYIEANSAIALAVAGLEDSLQNLNFKKQTAGDKLAGLFSIQLPNGKTLGSNKKIKFSLKGKLEKSEIWLLRGIGATVLITIIFLIFSGLLNNQMNNKKNEINGLITEQNKQISMANNDKREIETKTEQYRLLLADIKKTNEKYSKVAAKRNAIPNLLNQIMASIPNKVQLTSITNNDDTHVVIKAQSNNYEQLGYFVGVIKTKTILKNAVSSSSLKSGGTISVTIEGELP